MRLAWVTALLLAGILTLSTGCKQGEGDRCQLDSDCGDNLVCCVDPANLNEGGICRPQGKCDLNPTDSGTDGTSQDAEPDLVEADGPTPDQATPDQGPTPDKGVDQALTPDVTPAPDQQSSADSTPLDLSQG